MAMKFLVPILCIIFASPAFATGHDHQTKAEMATQSKYLYEFSGQMGIVCGNAQAPTGEVILKALRNTQWVRNNYDVSSTQSPKAKYVTVVSDHRGWGSNEVWEIFVGSDIIVKFGGNAQFTLQVNVFDLTYDPDGSVDNMAKLIYDHDGESKLYQMSCRLQ